MRRAFCTALLVAAAILGALPSSAAQPEIERAPYFSAAPDKMMKAYRADLVRRVFSEEFTERRRAKVIASIKNAPGVSCAQTFKVTIYNVLPFDARVGKPSWVERYAVTCDRVVGRNFLAILDGGTLQYVELARGDSRADPILQRDIHPAIVGIARSRAPDGCTSVVIADSLITRAPDESGGWEEKWEVAVCSVTFTVGLTFTASPKGGTQWNVRPL